MTELLGAYAIKRINFTKVKSEVTFKNPQWVEKMMVLNDVPVGGNKLVVKPIITSAADSNVTKKIESVGLTNLYIKDLPKEASSD